MIKFAFGLDKKALATSTLGVGHLKPRAQPLALLLLLVFALLANSVASNPAPKVPELETLAKKIETKIEERVIPGAVIMASINGETVFEQVMGVQDINTDKPITKKTLFRLYSMSKPITSVAIMILAEQGKLKLTDPVAKYIPEFATTEVYAQGELGNIKTVSVERHMTIRDLLTHSSGITYHFTGNTPVHQYYRKHGVKRYTPVGSSPNDGEAAKDLTELVQRIAKAPLLVQPGDTFAYSYSTTVLGYVIEQVTNKRLDAYLQEAIFTPLGMKDTGFFVEGKDLKRFMTNYQMTSNGLKAIETQKNTDYKDRNRLLDGGGALAGTARDYLRFASMLANGGSLGGVRLLQPRSVYRMLYPEVELSGQADSAGTFFGLGFAVGNNITQKSGMSPTGMYGWGGSANTNFWIDPDTRLAYVVMTQVITPPGFEKSLGVRELSTQYVAKLRQRLQASN
ncbi:serine hydrolase domain-containing protein [Halioxenophilus aromaticivorans]|uniref:Serine hydrolase domain-containing protein n=1 Tax=Halioxenophilus aromaticivorans TaxID=1306992 RepID=A0AAV3U384_9ALTE